MKILIFAFAWIIGMAGGVGLGFMIWFVFNCLSLISNSRENVSIKYFVKILNPSFSSFWLINF